MTLPSTAVTTSTPSSSVATVNVGVSTEPCEYGLWACDHLNHAVDLFWEYCDCGVESCDAVRFTK